MDMGIDVSRFDVFLVSLDPTQGSEIQKTRPCLVISPDEMNRQIRTVIVAPMTTTLRDYPTRISIYFQGKNGQVVLDQIRTVDKARLIKKMGRIEKTESQKVIQTLQELFAE